MQVSGQLLSSLASPNSREFLFQDGIYPDTKPGGYNGGHFLENNVIDIEYRTIGPQDCGIIKPPNVISISYGQTEGNVSLAYVQRQCWEYAKVRYICDHLFLWFSKFTARNDGDICDLQ